MWTKTRTPATNSLANVPAPQIMRSMLFPLNIARRPTGMGGGQCSGILCYGYLARKNGVGNHSGVAHPIAGFYGKAILQRRGNLKSKVILPRGKQINKREQQMYIHEVYAAIVADRVRRPQCSSESLHFGRCSGVSRASIVHVQPKHGKKQRARPGRRAIERRHGCLVGH